MTLVDDAEEEEAEESIDRLFSCLDGDSSSASSSEDRTAKKDTGKDAKDKKAKKVKKEGKTKSKKNKKVLRGHEGFGYADPIYQITVLTFHLSF